MTDVTNAAPRVAVILLTWNQKEMTLACLRSLAGMDYPNFGVVLVDNASEDGSAEAVERDYPEVTVIRNDKNLGVAGGRNVGLSHVLEKGADEFLLLLDNDTEVHPAFLTEMVRAGVEQPQAGILTGKIYFHDRPKVIWCAGGTLDLYRCDFRLTGHGETDQGQHDRLRDVDHVAGCCQMIARPALDAIGLLDERFSPYFCEDTDWCARAVKAGFRVLYVPRARLWHHVVKKTGVSDRYLFLKGRNLLLFMRKHARPQHWFFFVFVALGRAIAAVWRELRAGNIKSVLTMARGAFSALKTRK
jgi:GT2 family glycosyltransferase